MKKLLSLLGAIGLVATSSATVVACGPEPTNNDSDTATVNIDFVNARSFKHMGETILADADLGITPSTSEGDTEITNAVTFYAENTTVKMDSTTGALTDKDGQPLTEATDVTGDTTYVFAVVTTATPKATPKADGDDTSTSTYTLTTGNVVVGHDSTKGEKVSVEWFEAGIKDHNDTSLDNVTAKFNLENGQALSIYADATTVALNDDGTLNTSTNALDITANGFTAGTNYVYVITTTTEETITDYTYGQLSIGASYPLELTDADGANLEEISLVNTAGKDSIDVLFKNAGLVGTLTATASDTSALEITKDQNKQYFTIKANKTGEFTVTFSTNVTGVEDLTVNVHVTDPNTL